MPRTSARLQRLLQDQRSTAELIETALPVVNVLADAEQQ